MVVKRAFCLLLFILLSLVSHLRWNVHYFLWILLNKFQPKMRLMYKFSSIFWLLRLILQRADFPSISSCHLFWCKVNAHYCPLLAKSFCALVNFHIFIFASKQLWTFQRWLVCTSNRTYSAFFLNKNSYLNMNAEELLIVVVSKAVWKMFRVISWRWHKPVTFFSKPHSVLLVFLLTL